MSLIATYLSAALGVAAPAQAPAAPAPIVRALAPADAATSVTLASALVPSEEEFYTPLDVTLSPATAPALSSTDALTGEVVAAFDLTAAATFDRAELTLRLGASLAADGDAIAIYRSDDGSTWDIHAYDAAHDHQLGLVLAGNAQATRFALVNKARGGQIPTPVTSLTLGAAGAYTCPAGITTAHRYLNQDNQYAERLEYHDTRLTYAASELADPTQRTSGITFAGISTAPTPHFYFRNCTFDALPLHLSSAGTYAFDHCTFVNCPGVSVDARAQGAHVYVMGCTFKDNSPDKATWNQNVSGDRHSNYAAIRLRGQDATLTVCDSAFEHLHTDSNVIVQAPSSGIVPGMALYFERNTMTRCGGTGVVMDNEVAGRISHNVFTEQGATRGTEGYDASDHPKLGVGGNGKGVGGNAVFGRGASTQMRVTDNVVDKAMENGIEGTYHSISRNYVNTTGYRYDEGYRTVSTEGIAAAGTWFVTNNTVVNAHGRGIGVSLWKNHPVRVTGNRVSRWDKGSTEESTSEGIKIRTDADSYANVYVADNVLAGFEAAYRVIHADTASNQVRCVSNVEIHDVGDDALVSSVFRNMVGVEFRSEREVPLPFRENSAATASWRTSNVQSFAAGTDGGVPYVRLAAKAGDTHGRMWQTFDLPDEPCVVCLELKLRSNEPLVQPYVKSYDYATGTAYPTDDHGSYAEAKFPLEGVDAGEFRTYHVTFVARGRTDLGLWVADDTQTIDVAEVRGWYTTVTEHGPARATGAPQAAGRTAPTVAALTSAAVSATASAGFNDLAGVAAVPATVHVKQFGAWGDGEHNDAPAIQAAFDSGASTVLFEQGATYRCDTYLQLTHGNVTLLGNGATLLTDGRYSGSYTSGGQVRAAEFFLDVHGSMPDTAAERERVADAWADASCANFIRDISIYQLNLRSAAFAPSGAARYDYSKQLRVMMACDVDIWGCKLTIDQAVPGTSATSACGGFDLYSGWHNVTVENCETDNRCNRTSGGGIWIRDHFNMGASNCAFLGNTMYKTCHDEMIAVYNSAPTRKDPGVVPRYVERVLVSGNSITMRDGDPAATPSVMAMTTRNARELLVEGNTFDVWTYGGVFWNRQSTCVALRDNTVTMTKSPDAGKVGYVFRTEEAPAIDEVRGNKVTFSDALSEGSGKNYLVAGARRVSGNTIEVNAPTEEVFSGVGVAHANEVLVNAATGRIFNAVDEATDNKAVIRASVANYFQWFNRELTRDALVSGNRFYNHVDGSSRTVVSLNQARMSGHRVEFVNNTLVDDAPSASARLLWASNEVASAVPLARFAGNAFAGGVAVAAGSNTVLMEDNAATPVPEGEPVADDGPDPDDGAGGVGSGSGSEATGNTGSSEETKGSGGADAHDRAGTPHAAETPDAVATPETAGTPSTAGTPGTPGTPDTAATPGAGATPGTPQTPTSAATPTTAMTPDAPETPATTTGTWYVEGDRWHYRDATGRAPHGWMWDDGLWYRLDQGALVTGWIWDDGWYYLTEDSDVAPQGSMRVGWLCDQGTWYFLNTPDQPGFAGLMRTGWVWDGWAWYFCDPSGAMRTGWVWDGSAWHYLDPTTGRWVG